ncbi:MAG TPA: acyl-CoA dehydrogenase family protein [Actinomycetota bacterium]|nr:acyl-CoA dehydrogenase family protein [Actinomycetota bacterium]
MDFGLTDEQRRFYEELLRFFAEDRVQKSIEEMRTLPPRREDGFPDIYRWLGERGWLAVNWPVEYGGLGKTAVEAGLVSEQLALNGVPDLTHVLSVDIVGLFLLLVGTPEQKRRFLPPIARGEKAATVLYTEPQSGSDLSSLQTRAERDGDGWRLYGRKTFPMKSPWAEHALTAARTRDTGNKFEGITLFMVPLREGGVEIRPLWGMGNERFDDALLDGVRVTPDDVVGGVDRGWQIINSVLALERTGVDYQGRVRRWTDMMIARARATGKLSDPQVAHQLAALDAQATAGRLLTFRVLGNVSRGVIDEVASAMAKWYNTELGKSVVRAWLELEGLEAVLSQWDGEAPIDGILEGAYRETPGMTIAAGTSEIMLYVIAANGLRLFQ